MRCKFSKAFTLLEMIFVVVISGVLAIGSFKAMQSLYIRSAKAKAVTDMSLRSQIVLDQIGVMLYNRIPNSIIGSNPDCQPISDITSEQHVLEWLGTMEDDLIERKYDGFVDIEKSDKDSKTLVTPDIKSIMEDKDLDDNINLVFSGAFDGGTESIKACSGAFGYHGAADDLSFDVIIEDNKIKIDGDQPKYIYEKYYLTDTAYAITRGEHIADITNCSTVDSENDFKDFNNTLFLFYNYQPYNGETYCGDGGAGDVSILAENVTGFEILYENDSIRLQLDMTQEIRGSTAVHLSKQKVVF
ncbi:MAG: prepilin-type N-terminal cleavage/methylation domain-containing protein [Campylobacterota bacterium]|nr:prepilin-type N-terminal cleavage/methylation domain-containing protein [Campylobacterota bacterium]